MPRPAIALLALLSPAALSAARIDFEEFSPIALPFDQSMIESAGFRISLLTAPGLAVIPLTSFCPAGCVSNGTATLAALNSSVLELTSVSGAPFDFLGFDLAGTFQASSANIKTLVVEGEFSNGGAIALGFSAAHPDAFSTFALSGFTSLRAVRFRPVAAQDPTCTGCPEYQLDNLEVVWAAVAGPSPNSPSPVDPSVPTLVTLVPEPGGVCLTLAGIGVCAWLRRRPIAS